MLDWVGEFDDDVDYVEFLRSKGGLPVEATAESSMEIAEADEGSLEETMDADVAEGVSPAQSLTIQGARAHTEQSPPSATYHQQPAIATFRQASDKASDSNKQATVANVLQSVDCAQDHGHLYSMPSPRIYRQPPNPRVYARTIMVPIINPTP